MEEEYKDIEDIELRSDEVKEILGTPPNWLVQWGSTILLFILCVLFTLGWYYKYPEKIDAPIMVTTTIPPLNVVSRMDGYLTKLNVKEGDYVYRGDQLGVIQSSGDYEDILSLEEGLKKYEEKSAFEIARHVPMAYLNIGDIQTYYNQLVEAIRRFDLYSSEKFDQSEIADVRKQINSVQQNIRIVEQKQKTLIGERNIASRRLKRSQELYSQGIISQADYEKEQAAFEDYNIREQNLKAEKENLLLSIKQLEQNINQVKQRTKIENEDQATQLESRLKQVLTAIDNWKDAHVLTAPAEGKISFPAEVWTEQQYVNRGVEIMVIVPDSPSENSDKQQLLGKISLPIVGSGKVDLEDRVIIKFSSFPHHEYGVVEAKITHKAPVPKNDAYLLEVAFPKGLMTSYAKELPFQQNMVGVATVITDDKRFLERIFEKLLAAFRNN